MDRKPATAQDIALVVAAADVAARYASQNAMTKMELGMMIADLHALLVDRVDHGPRARTAADSDGEAPIAQPVLGHKADEPKAKPPVTAAPSEEADAAADGAGTKAFRREYIVAPPLVEPFLPIEASVWTDRIVCLDCGKRFATLKRHLLAVHKQTDTEYRKKYGLSATYPMICEAFESSRRQLMLDHGAFKPLTREQRKARSLKAT